MKRVSLKLDDTTYDLILRKAVPLMPPVPHRTTKLVDRAASRLIHETILDAFPSGAVLCDKCGEAFSVEGDEGSIREEGAFCTKHLPKDGEGMGLMGTESRKRNGSLTAGIPSEREKDESDI